MDSQHNKSPFLTEVRHLMRVQNYAIRTENAYVDWIKRFILLALPLIEWVDYLTEDERQRFVHPNIGYISSLESNRC